MIKTALNHFIFDKFISIVFDNLIKEFTPCKIPDLYSRSIGEFIDMKINDGNTIQCQLIEIDGEASAKLRYDNGDEHLIFHVAHDQIVFIDGSVDLFSDLLINQ